MFIPDQDDARALFADAIEHVGIYLPTLDCQVYDINEAVDEDKERVEFAFRNWISELDLPDHAKTWTLIN